jgi:hypothetical protein
MLMVRSNMAVLLEVDATTRQMEENIRPVAIALTRVLVQLTHANVRERTSANFPVNV